MCLYGGPSLLLTEVVQRQPVHYHHSLVVTLWALALRASVASPSLRQAEPSRNTRPRPANLILSGWSHLLAGHARPTRLSSVPKRLRSRWQPVMTNPEGFYRNNGRWSMGQGSLSYTGSSGEVL